jgi:hypothetical protein
MSVLFWTASKNSSGTSETATTTTDAAQRMRRVQHKTLLDSIVENHHIQQKEDNNQNQNDDGRGGDGDDKVPDNDGGGEGDDKQQNDDKGGDDDAAAATTDEEGEAKGEGDIDYSLVAAAVGGDRNSNKDNQPSTDDGTSKNDDEGGKDNGDGEGGGREEEGEAEGEDVDSAGKEEFYEDFPKIKIDHFQGWIKFYYDKLQWDKHPEEQQPEKDRKRLLNRDILTESLRLGCDYIVANQKDEGNFNYQYNFVDKKMDTEDSQVRQAGALWGVTLCFQSHPDNTSYQKATEKGLRYFMERMQLGPTHASLMIQYEDDDESETGTNALFGLAVIDYLRTLRDNKLKTSDKDLVTELETKYLVGVIQFLKYMQDQTNKHFSKGFRISKRIKSGLSSPYFDGEAMLCLIKAARYMEGFNILIPRIVDTAPILFKVYTVDEWSVEHDSDRTKGFYQWSSMFAAGMYQICYFSVLGGLFRNLSKCFFTPLLSSQPSNLI